MDCFKKLVVPIGLTVWLASSLCAPPVMAEQVSSLLRQGLPGRRISGGSRSDCMAGSSPIVALSSTTNLNKTTNEQVSLYFIVPALERNYPLRFSLRDSMGNRVHEALLNTAENQGTVGIQLPKDTLQTDQDYRWYLSVVCDTQDPSQNDVLSGWIRQVGTSTAIELGETLHTEVYSVEAGLTLANRYQEAELWGDAIATMVALREQFPQDDSLYQAWNQLLQTLELESVVSPSIASR